MRLTGQVPGGRKCANVTLGVGPLTVTDDAGVMDLTTMLGPRRWLEWDSANQASTLLSPSAAALVGDDGTLDVTDVVRSARAVGRVS